MLAVGTTEGKIHILTQDYQVGQSTSKNGSRTGLQSGSFKYRQSLTGHADWVRSLSFTAPLDLSASATLASDYESGDVLLASGSQDTYTRTWRVTAEPVKQDRASGSGALQSLDLLMESEIDAKRYSFVHRYVSSPAAFYASIAYVTNQPAGTSRCLYMPSQSCLDTRIGSRT